MITHIRQLAKRIQYPSLSTPVWWCGVNNRLVNILCSVVPYMSFCVVNEFINKLCTPLYGHQATMKALVFLIKLQFYSTRISVDVNYSFCLLVIFQNG